MTVDVWPEFMTGRSQATAGTEQTEMTFAGASRVATVCTMKLKGTEHYKYTYRFTFSYKMYFNCLTNVPMNFLIKFLISY